MSRPDRSAARRRLRGDDGSVLGEFAMIVPVLVLLLSGTFELGMAWRTRNDLQSALRLALRLDTNMGDNSLADWNTVLALQANLARVRNLQVNYVIVYKGSTTPSTTTSVPSNCLNIARGLAVTSTSPQGVNGTCNIYTRQMIANTKASPVAAPSYNCTAQGSPNSAWDKFWCPRTRQSGASANGGNGPDTLGLYAEFTYTTYTKLLGTSVTMTDGAVGRLEPG